MTSVCSWFISPTSIMIPCSEGPLWTGLGKSGDQGDMYTTNTIFSRSTGDTNEQLICLSVVGEVNIEVT